MDLGTSLLLPVRRRGASPALLALLRSAAFSSPFQKILEVTGHDFRCPFQVSIAAVLWRPHKARRVIDDATTAN